ncbi:hypothetical protein SHIRM173S_02815 [Streptomyces hirsutus]
MPVPPRPTYRRTSPRRTRRTTSGERHPRRHASRLRQQASRAAPGHCPPTTTSRTTTRSGATPVHGDDALFERLSLEAFQSGLSWITILRRRPGFRTAFADFRIATVAEFTDADLRAAARRRRNHPQPREDRRDARQRARAGRLGAGRPGRPDLVRADPAGRPAPITLADVPAVTPESTALSKALKKQGLRFVGPTTAYALMQACGLVNDHLRDCVAPTAP